MPITLNEAKGEIRLMEKLKDASRPANANDPYAVNIRRSDVAAGRLRSPSLGRQELS